MTGARMSAAADDISVVLVVHNRLELTRACIESMRDTTLSFELCVLDNASTDGTRDYLESDAVPVPVRYQRNDDNVGLIRALNQAARIAHGRYLCYLHNDTEMLDRRWLERLRGAVADGERVGLAGLYGARRIRRDGRFAGRSIVHALRDGTRTARMPAPIVEVAVVDGVCLFVPRTVLAAVGGFDEGYGFFHGYDRELSFAVREAGWRSVVVDVPFVHRGGGTRTGADAPVPAREDLAQRRAVIARFAGKGRHRLPTDVRSYRERLADRFRAQDR